MRKQQEISTLIPHGPGMSLIDEIVDWDQQTLAARTMSHTAPDNPLRGQKGLHCIHLVEYAAQCMALHAALTAVLHATQPMVVGALRNIHLPDVNLDTLTSPLLIQVDIAMTGKSGAIYNFSVGHQGTSTGSGRVTLLAPLFPSPNQGVSILSLQ
ncbi:MAG: hypothetical protein WD356_10720 [Pseudomonadales bacterium]